MTISSSTNRADFAGNGSTTAFATGFKYFTTTDLSVILVTDSTGAEVVQTITTHYTVSAAGLAAGGTVTMVTAPASGETLVIVRAQPYTQGLDLVENDDFPSDSVEQTLDKTVIMAQQLLDAQSRSVQLPDGFTGTFDTTLPPLIGTANSTVVTNATGVGWSLGPTTTAITAAEAEATAAAASAAAAAVSETNAATTYDNFDDRYLGQKAADPTLDNDGDALLTGALYFNTSNNVMMAYTGSAWVRTTPTSGDQTTINSVNDNATNINTVAGVAANVTTVAGISSDVTTVAADGTDIGVVSGISANVTTVAGISADVTTVAGISGDVSAVAAQVIGYDFSTTTTMDDPGSGNLRFNNATLASVTAIAIDDLDKNGVDQSAYVALWDDSTNTVKGTLVFRTSGGDVATFNITGLTDNAGWSQVAVTHVASSGTFGNGEDTFIGFSRAGDAGAGDVIGPASATDNAVARYDTTTGELLQDSAVTISDAGAIAGVTTLNGVAAPTAQYTSAEETKLAGIEALADVTDATNVLAGLVGQEVVATGFTGTLDGVLGGGSPAAVTGTTGTFSSVVKTLVGRNSVVLGDAFNFTEHHNINVGGTTAFATILTISPSGVAGSYTMGMVEAIICGDTGGVGNGVTVSKWNFSISNAAPTVSVIGTDATSGTGAAVFKLVVSGNNILVQMSSSDATGAFGGMADIKVYAPKASSTVFNYTIS